MITYKINADYIAAVKTKDVDKRDALKLVKAAFSNMEIERKAQGYATEQDYINVLNKLVKKGEEAQLAYDKAGENEKAFREAYEVGLYRAYLPRELTSAEVLVFAEQAVASLGTEPTKKDKGNLIKLVKEKTQGTANGKLISDIVDQLIATYTS